jgi:hypothetical protein
MFNLDLFLAVRCLEDRHFAPWARISGLCDYTCMYALVCRVPMYIGVDVVVLNFTFVCVV